MIYNWFITDLYAAISKSQQFQISVSIIKSKLLTTQRKSTFCNLLPKYSDESLFIFQAPKDSVPEIARWSLVAMIDY